jgi:hypothetical protein
VLLVVLLLVLLVLLHLLLWLHWVVLRGCCHVLMLQLLLVHLLARKWPALLLLLLLLVGAAVVTCRTLACISLLLLLCAWHCCMLAGVAVAHLPTLLLLLLVVVVMVHCCWCRKLSWSCRGAATARSRALHCYSSSRGSTRCSTGDDRGRPKATRCTRSIMCQLLLPLLRVLWLLLLRWRHGTSCYCCCWYVTLHSSRVLRPQW